jgi:hypothetical protein
LVGAYENRHELINTHDTLLPFLEKLGDHKNSVFMPAIRRLTSAGILVVKNGGPVQFLEQVSDLLKEVFEASRQLSMMRTAFDNYRAFRRYEQGSPLTSGQHLSHTVPALESLISLHLIGGYIFKRSRFEYVRTLFRADVHRVGPEPYEETNRAPMVFWPLVPGCGEPEELAHVPGRINLCADRVAADETLRGLFGSRQVAADTLCQYEFCLELNSFLSVSTDDSRDTAAYVAKQFPDTDFAFGPSLIAFRLAPIMPLALQVYKEILAGRSEFVKLLVFDSALASMITKGPRGAEVYGRFLRGLARSQAELFLAERRFLRIDNWPRELKQLISSQ